MGVVSQRAEGGRNDSFRDAFVPNTGDVVDAHAVIALSDIQIFTAQLQALSLASGVAGGVLQFAVVLQMVCIPSGVGVPMQIAADDRLRLIPLGYANCVDFTGAADISVIADEVDEVGAQH